MRVLIIEDYPPLRKALIQGLKESGFSVDATGDGEEGLWYAESNPYDVIILDLMLPGMSGWEILRSLRQQGRMMPVLILTARDAVDDRVKGLDLGADDYLVKPFAFEELLARVRALVRRGYQKKDPLIRIADLEIDTARKIVKRGDNLISLTPREYALLEYLAFRQGEVVSRSDIWEHVYDFHSEASSNVVDVYIGYLRRKIDKGFKQKLIHTRRGMGYWLGLPQDKSE
ncbi:response regulator transcription factor [Candidatus Sumerlaeota bacterium]|nr:response regulator transcription factor [Candidatus Sumerlaeota bacterium]